MPVARNMKELEQMILGQLKKKLPVVTKEYCHTWYSKHDEMKDIVSEDKFVQMVTDSMKVSVVNGNVSAEFGIFNNEDVPSDKHEKMSKLWEEFKGGYMDYVIPKILPVKK